MEIWFVSMAHNHCYTHLKFPQNRFPCVRSILSFDDCDNFGVFDLTNTTKIF